MHGHRVDARVRDRVRATTRSAGSSRVDAAYERRRTRTSGPPRPQVLGALDALVDDDDIVINAAGSLPGDLHKLWRARSRDQYHLEYGYSCMGYEIPAAIGVRLAAPGPPVWALVGDGTYLMMPTEIVTAVQEGIPIKVVILQNHGYASIGGLSESVGGERFGTAYRYRAADGTYTGAPLPVDLAANAASPRHAACCAPRPCVTCAKPSPRRVPRTVPHVSTSRPKRQTQCRARPRRRRGGMFLWPRPRPARRRSRPARSTTGTSPARRRHL